MTILKLFTILAAVSILTYAVCAAFIYVVFWLISFSLHTNTTYAAPFDQTIRFSNGAPIAPDYQLQSALKSEAINE